MNTQDSSAGIAIIGMSCRMPGASSPAAFWRNLRDGIEAVRFLTADDLAAAGLDPRILQNPAYVNAAIRLEGIDLFDATFFGFSPREAELLDPQQRLFLECAWEALENAACVPEYYRGLIGVFAGVNSSHYVFNLYANQDLVRTMGMFQISVANDKDHISTRTAYKLNLRGPAITVQTTCSTSLVAVCQACQSLLNYQCDVAVAGASSILLNQNGYMYQDEGIPSPDGHCRAFDAMAKGTVGGSGVGVVVLKRLNEALADGDPIHAIVRGFAVNNDGAVKVGYTAPSIDGQAEVISMAFAMGTIDPETIGYVEAHGTGTPLGDPIEVTALTKAFRDAGAKRNQYCGIGSVKSNIGHLDPAAGVAGLLKAVLALQHRSLPPSLHFKQPNPNIDFENSPFFVNASLAEWKANGQPRLAGVSSFGIGGTNAHVIVEEAPTRTPGSVSRPFHLLLTSGRTSVAADAAARNLGNWLRDHRDASLGDVAWTLQTGRKPFAWRRMALCKTDELDQAITRLESTGGACAAGRGGPLQVAMVFSGQGSQYLQMGRDLYERERVFRESFDACADLLHPHIDSDLRDVVYPKTGADPEAHARLTQTAWAQPALFSVEYALARLWQHWGVTPNALAGHSIGELVAACLAEVFTLQDALMLVAARGRLMQSMPPGAMIAIMLAEEEVAGQLPATLSIAAINSPGSTVVAGPVDEIDRFQRQLEALGTGCRRLQTSHAFHSQMMEPILEAFAEQVRRTTPRSPQLPLLSNVTGDWMTPAQATDPSYWAGHIRAPVRFLDSMNRLLAQPEQVLLEVGPGRTAATLAQQTAAKIGDRTILHSLPLPNTPQTDTQCMLESLGRLWILGQEVNWTSYYENEQRLRVCLPTYPFERQRYWIDAPAAGSLPSQERAGAGARDPAQWVYEPVWESSPDETPFVEAALAAQDCNWLILGSAGDIGEHVAGLLAANGQRVAHVRAGTTFRHCGGNAFVIDPGCAAHYEALIDALELNHCMPQRILHLLCHSAELPRRGTAEAAVQHGFYSLLYLSQALGTRRFQRPVELAYAADRLHPSDADSDPMPENALALGLLRVVPQEIPGLRCRGVELRNPAAAPTDNQARQLIAELIACPFEPAVILDGSSRRVEHWRSLRLAATEGPPPRVRERGVYLITGGTGKIGLALADYLARAVRARLVLLGRTALPPRWQWEDRVRHNTADAVSIQLSKLIELERHGAQVMVLAADVGDADQMREAVATVVRDFGPINGVIHAAGHTTAATRPLAQINHEFAEAHFRAKVRGPHIIDALVATQSLDFVLLMSSLSSILGGLGFGAYAAANAYLDSYAATRNRHSFVPYLCVNWDGWDFSSAPADGNLLPRDGVETARRLLCRRIERAAVSVTPLTERLRRWVFLDQASAEPPRTEDLATGSTVARHARPNLSTAYVAARNETEAAIVAVWQDLLGVEPIGIEDNYFELGGHSLLAIQVGSRLRDHFGTDLAVQTLFEAPTVVELAQRIEDAKSAADSQDETHMKALLAQIEKLSDEEVQALLAEKER